jgi:hypothetical protein
VAHGSSACDGSCNPAEYGTGEVMHCHVVAGRQDWVDARGQDAGHKQTVTQPGESHKHKRESHKHESDNWHMQGEAGCRTQG